MSLCVCVCARGRRRSLLGRGCLYLYWVNGVRSGTSSASASGRFFSSRTTRHASSFPPSSFTTCSRKDAARVTAFTFRLQTEKGHTCTNVDPRTWPSTIHRDMAVLPSEPGRKRTVAVRGLMLEMIKFDGAPGSSAEREALYSKL